MMSCTSANVACRLDRMDGIDTLTTKKSRPTRNAAARTTASDSQRPGSVPETPVAAADGAVVLCLIALLLRSQKRIQAILHAMDARARKTLFTGILGAI